tara:strand:+ start:26851 stop:27909 length:1059 start_codon:yes stop_codon:yes gene_type:complete
MKKHNFSAGPCILPETVLEKASKSLINFNNENLSLIEISHRSNSFVEVMNKTRNLVIELLEIPRGYSVLFLQGGASLEFAMVPLNLMKFKNGKAAYLNTGTWAKKSITEAKKFGEIYVVGDSSDQNYSYIPKNYEIPNDSDYFHCTSNNTIYGTQMKKFPELSTLMVCDMSSDIFSKKININNFDLIYAGAQKNLGPAGCTLVIVKDDILGNTGRNIPTMLNYKTHIDKESMFNTPPVFSIYVSMLNLEWLRNHGGIEWIEEVNNKKAEILYSEIDRNRLFEGFAKEEDRSNMNITFDLIDKNLKNKFDIMWKEAGIYGINGHRSVGGYRASIYNALPIESVNLLANIMKKL